MKKLTLILSLLTLPFTVPAPSHHPLRLKSVDFNNNSGVFLFDVKNLNAQPVDFEIEIFIPTGVAALNMSLSRLTN